MKSKLIKSINDRIKIYQIHQSYLAFDEYDCEFFYTISARQFQIGKVNNKNLKEITDICIEYIQNGYNLSE
jgi:hypothetical protein